MKSNTLSPATAIGLLISLFSLGFFATLYREWYGITTSTVIIRESLIFLLVGVLIAIIYKFEHNTLESIGLRFTAIKTSLINSIIFLLISMAGIALCLLAMQFLGWKVGGGEGNAYKDIPLIVFFFVVLRAGIAEEIFYRGYAIERINTLTGNRWVAVVIPLIIFSIGHFRQGPGGILISFVAGGILSATYLWKRDLLANVIAHFLIDFIPNILVPLLGGDLD